MSRELLEIQDKPGQLAMVRECKADRYAHQRFILGLGLQYPFRIGLGIVTKDVPERDLSDNECGNRFHWRKDDLIVLMQDERGERCDYGANLLFRPLDRHDQMCGIHSDEFRWLNRIYDALPQLEGIKFPQVLGGKDNPYYGHAIEGE